MWRIEPASRAAEMNGRHSDDIRPALDHHQSRPEAHCLCWPHPFARKEAPFWRRRWRYVTYINFSIAAKIELGLPRARNLLAGATFDSGQKSPKPQVHLAAVAAVAAVAAAIVGPGRVPVCITSVAQLATKATDFRAEAALRARRHRRWARRACLRARQNT